MSTRKISASTRQWDEIQGFQDWETKDGEVTEGARWYEGDDQDKVHQRRPGQALERDGPPMENLDEIRRSRTATSMSLSSARGASWQPR